MMDNKRLVVVAMLVSLALTSIYKAFMVFGNDTLDKAVQKTMDLPQLSDVRVNGRHAPSDIVKTMDSRQLPDVRVQGPHAHSEDGRGRRCIVLGMLNRASEFEIRNWHRKMFHRDGNNHTFSDLVDIKLVYGMAIDLGDPSVMRKVFQEKKKYQDIIFFDFEELEECMPLNRCLMLSISSLFHRVKNLCDDKVYEASYVIKMDNDVVLNYERMAEVFLSLPTRSVMLGRLLPMTAAVTSRRERYLANFAHEFFPIWPHGTFQGYSRDVLEMIMAPENMAPILREDVPYIFPWSDRAAGLQIDRAQIPIKHMTYMKGCYTFCSPEMYSCDAYWNAVSFHIGFGHSGRGSGKIKKKLELLSSVYEMQSHCEPPSTHFDKSQHYFFVNESFTMNHYTSHWAFDGCSQIGDAGKKLKLIFTEAEERALAVVKVDPATDPCSESLYQRQLKGLGDLHHDETTGNSPFISEFVSACARHLLHKANLSERQGQSGQTRSTSREHFLSQGYKSNSLDYFCPDDCRGSSNLQRCLDCDVEAAYLQNYPDVLQAVTTGRLESGLQHFKAIGINEGRRWSCRSVHEDGNGTKAGCLKVFSDFINHTYPLVQDWPIHGDPKFMVNESKCNAMILVDGRDHPWLDYILRVHRHFLGPYWLIYLIGPKAVADTWREKYDGHLLRIVDVPDRFVDLANDPDDYNRLLLSQLFWRDIVKCENVLLTRADTLLLRYGIEDFFRYDFVGAPVYPESFPQKHWRLLHAFQRNHGGSGGLSFRKRSAMLKALDSCPLPREGSPEDAWFSACLVLSGGKLPHPTIANRFSIGTKCQVDVPLGSHKPWTICKESSCTLAIVSSQLHIELYGESTTQFCAEGEDYYLWLNDDVRRAVEDGHWRSGWDHFNATGSKGGRRWRCLTQ